MSQVTMVRDYRKHAYSFEFESTDESKEAAIDPKLGIKGEVVKIILVLPDWTNTVTAIVTMINEDGKEIFATTSKAQNDEYDITLDKNECIIMGDTGEKWKVTLSGAPGTIVEGEETVTITAYVQG